MPDPRNEVPLTPGGFALRMASSILQALLLLVSWVALGVVGYHHYAQYNWIDSVLNASMVASGMGQVSALTTDQAKIFASIYAVASGVVFLSIFALVLGPIAHRMMHRFHHAQQSAEAERSKNNPARS